MKAKSQREVEGGKRKIKKKNREKECMLCVEKKNKKEKEREEMYVVYLL